MPAVTENNKSAGNAEVSRDSLITEGIFMQNNTRTGGAENADPIFRSNP